MWTLDLYPVQFQRCSPSAAEIATDPTRFPPAAWTEQLHQAASPGQQAPSRNGRRSRNAVTPGVRTEEADDSHGPD